MVFIVQVSHTLLLCLFLGASMQQTIKEVHKNTHLPQEEEISQIHNFNIKTKLRKRNTFSQKNQKGKTEKEE